jgi:FdhD protein
VNAVSETLAARAGLGCDADPPGSAGAQALTVLALRDGRLATTEDWVADEVAVALEFNGISHAVMLATPLDLEDFALGFALSEGILDRPDQLYAVETVRSGLGITLQLRVAGAAFARLKDRRRTVAGRTGCGLCGAESLAQVARALPALPARPGAFSAQAISRAMAQLAPLQVLQQTTGAAHAAAWCSADGELRWLREDIGRHNALDKLIGALARDGADAGSGFVVVTSRASYEMVQKAASAGVALLAAVSAPTSMAVATARGAGLCLVGFARQQDLVIYSHADRLRV